MAETRTDRWGAGSPTAERAAAGTGVVFAVLAAIGFIILGQPDADATGDEIVQYFAENESATQWQALLFGVAAAFYLWFGATIAGAVRRAEGDPAARIPAAIVVTAAASAAIYLAGEAAWLALARTAGEEGTTRTLFDLGGNAFALSGFIAGAFAFAVSLGIIRTRLLDDWVAWAGTAVAALLVVSGVVELFAEPNSSFAQVLGSIAFFAFVIWVGVTSLAYWLGLAAATRREPARTAV